MLLKITIDGAAYDEAEVIVVPDTPAVRGTIRSWQSCCEFYCDGSIKCEEVESASGDCARMDAEEFLDYAANALGADADEIEGLPALWRAGQEWRRS
jgi:hypothetical protein